MSIGFKNCFKEIWPTVIPPDTEKNKFNSSGWTSKIFLYFRIKRRTFQFFVITRDRKSVV